MSGGTSCLLLFEQLVAASEERMSGGTSCLLLFEQLVAASEDRT